VILLSDMKFVRVKQVGKVCFKYNDSDRKGSPIYNDATIVNNLYRRSGINHSPSVDHKSV
jgi:hypothetical protein